MSGTDVPSSAAALPSIPLLPGASIPGGSPAPLPPSSSQSQAHPQGPIPGGGPPPGFFSGPPPGAPLYSYPPPPLNGGGPPLPGGEAVVKVEVKEEEEEDDDEPLPEGANETVYVRNLNEKVRIPVLKETLTNLFSIYGDVLSVTAQSNVRMRGQAFVTLNTKKAANKAVKDIQGFPLYGRPVQLDFAKTRSDSVVQRDLKEEEKLDAEGQQAGFEVHKKQRLERKQVARTEWRTKLRARKTAEKRAAAGETDVVAPSAAQRRQNVQMPDEYVPPNKILFLQNIAAKFGRDELEKMFNPLPNLVEVRTIPGKSDIAFVEFTDIPSSAAAREKVNGYAFPDGSKLRVTFARA